MKSKLIFIIAFVAFVVLLAVAYLVHWFHVTFGPRLDSPAGYQRYEAVRAQNLTNQIILANVALTDELDSVRSAAVDKLTDQSLLEKIALTPQASDGIRAAAVKKLTNQTLLARIALENNEYTIRREAVRKLTNQAVLAKITVEDENADIRAAAGARLNVQERKSNNLLLKVAVRHRDHIVAAGANGRLNIDEVADQALLAQTAIEGGDVSSRLAAVQKITDQKLLIGILIQRRNDSRIRANALLGIAHEGLIRAVANGDPDVLMRTTAVLLLSSQSDLQQVALRDPLVVVREAAVAEITDDDFLLQRIREEPSPTVCTTIVHTLKAPESILAAATGSYYRIARDAAHERLVQTGDKERIEQSRAADNQIVEEAKALLSAAEPVLAKTALHGKFDVLCRLAASELREPASLKRVVLESTDREVIGIALRKISNVALLEEIAGTPSRDSAVSLAALQKAGRLSWGQIFRQAANNPKALGDALAAVSLSGTVQLDAKNAVEQACLALIQQGSESRIPEMIDLLEDYGSKELAEDYMNCGQPDLNNAGHAWAAKRGFSIKTGFGSSRARWGSR